MATYPRKEKLLIFLNAFLTSPLRSDAFILWLGFSLKSKYTRFSFVNTKIDKERKEKRKNPSFLLNVR